jgi:hypothetical protein
MGEINLNWSTISTVIDCQVCLSQLLNSCAVETYKEDLKKKSEGKLMAQVWKNRAVNGSLR